MTSRILRPVERMIFTFGDAGNGDTTTLARRINVAAFKEVTAYVRLHPNSVIGTAPSTLAFVINADGYTDEDPAAQTVATIPLPAFQTQLSSTSLVSLAIGGMQVIAVGLGGTNQNFGSMLSLQLVVKTATATQISLILSVDLICKEF
jgi:hypothetical protein